MSGLPVRIAVVDDDAAVLESARFLLEVEGHSVQSFLSGTDFLRVLSESPFDCLILDHHMPELTGLELAERLRAEGRDLPIMLISGALTKDIAARAEDIGVEKLAEKPISFEELIGFVESARTNVSRLSPS